MALLTSFVLLLLLLPPTHASRLSWPVSAFPSSSVFKRILVERMLQSLCTYLQLFSETPIFLPLLPPWSSLTLNVLVIRTVLRDLQIDSMISYFCASTHALLLPGMSFQVLFCLASFFSPFKSLLKHCLSNEISLNLQGLPCTCLVAHQDRVTYSLSWITARTFTCFNFGTRFTYG